MAFLSHRYSELLIPQLPVADLRTFCEKGVLACCIPIGTEAADTSVCPSTLKLMQSDRCLSWLVSSSSDVKPGPRQKALYEPNLRGASFQLSWNESYSYLPNLKAGTAAVRFTLDNAYGSEVCILRRDCVTDVSIRVTPDERTELQGCDIIALRTPDGHERYYVFRHLVEMFPTSSLHDRYDLLRVLGRGAYGVIWETPNVGSMSLWSESDTH
ncbi:hypothetical protein PENSPDRAFT_737060, partial [Peniophora sp. CONT]